MTTERKDEALELYTVACKIASLKFRVLGWICFAAVILVALAIWGFRSEHYDGWVLFTVGAIIGAFIARSSFLKVKVKAILKNNNYSIDSLKKEWAELNHFPHS